MPVSFLERREEQEVLPYDWSAMSTTRSTVLVRILFLVSDCEGDENGYCGVREAGTGHRNEDPDC